MTPIRSSRTPRETQSWLLEFGGDGMAGDAVADAVVSASGLTAVLLAATPTTVQYEISGGVAGRTGLVSVLVTTVLGNTHEVEHTVVVVR